MVFRNAPSMEPAVREALSTAWPCRSWTARLTSVFGGSEISMLRGCGRLSTFVLDFSAFLPPSWRLLLPSLHSWFSWPFLRSSNCDCEIVGRTVYDQGPPIFKEPFFSLNRFCLWLRISRHQDEGFGALDQPDQRGTVVSRKGMLARFQKR